MLAYPLLGTLGTAPNRAYIDSRSAGKSCALETLHRRGQLDLQSHERFRVASSRRKSMEVSQGLAIARPSFVVPAGTLQQTATPV